MFTGISNYDGSTVTDETPELVRDAIEEFLDEPLEDWACHEDGKLVEFQCTRWVSGRHYHEQCENLVPWPGMECELHE